MYYEGLRRFPCQVILPTQAVMAKHGNVWNLITRAGVPLTVLNHFVLWQLTCGEDATDLNELAVGLGPYLEEIGFDFEHDTAGLFPQILTVTYDLYRALYPHRGLLTAGSGSAERVTDVQPMGYVGDDMLVTMERWVRA